MDQDYLRSNIQNNPNLALIVGLPLISLVLNWGLFGVLSIQVYVYYQGFQKDRWSLKALVYTVYAIETSQTALLTHDAWHSFVIKYRCIPGGFDNVGTTWLSLGLIGGIVSFLVQFFYVYRLSVISKSKLITWFVMMLAITSLGGSIATSVFLYRLKHFSDLTKYRLQGYILIGIWEGAGSVCDIVIAVCMTYYLRKLSLYDGAVPKTQRFVSKLIRMIVETGTLTATVSLISLVLYYVYSPKPYYYIPLLCLAKLYSNTMMAAIISRGISRSMSESAVCGDLEISQIQYCENTSTLT